ncbi:MAG: RNA-directed DNA polymerase [Giesbergeria sp.]
MQVAKPNLLAVRALQATRRLHLPTYIAIRYLVDSVFGSAESGWIETTLPRKYPRRSVPRFQSVMRFKKLNGSGELEYREFTVPSPSTALTEALVLSHMSGSIGFAKSRSVYSYLWPIRPDKSPFSFEHYVNGYKTRNNDIARYLEANPDYVVVVSDIEKFYPNIQKSKVKPLFVAALNASEIPTEIRETAMRLLEHLFSLMPGDKGVPTGPELSHVIGDLALATIDRSFDKTYPGAYFRYVDDIVIAIPKSEVESALHLLHTLASAEGLTIHPDKIDQISGHEWLAHGPHHLHRVTPNSFEALIFQIKVFLRTHPSSTESLSAKLDQLGFAIPIERLMVAAKSDGFGQRLAKFLKQRWRIALNASIASERSLLDRAEVVRAAVRSELHAMLNDLLPTGSTLRKWHIQKIRYLTNRAFYLFPTKELSFLRDPLDKLPEFAETVALLRLLIDFEVFPILLMPGAALTAGCGVLRQTGQRLPKIEKLAVVTPVILESLAIIMTFDVCDIADEVIDALTPDEREFLLFCSGKPQLRRAAARFTYLDEIRCLQMSQSSADRFIKIESRFSDQESVVLDALDIGGDYDY